MKRKHANRLDWHRVIKKDFVSRFFDEEGFKGYITLIRIHKVTEPLIRKIADQEICLVDEGYYWMQHFPEEANYCVTTMLNKKKEIVQWYFDVTKSNGISEEGIPYWEDLYLDVIVFPNGDFYIKDEDELEEALNSNHITETEYILAKNIAENLVREIEAKQHTILKNTMKYFNYMIQASQ